MIFSSIEVRDAFHRLVPTHLQHELAELEARTLAPGGQTVMIENVTASEVTLKVTDKLIGPSLSVED